MKRNDLVGLLMLTVFLGGVLALAVLAPQSEPKVYGPVEVPGSALAILPNQEAGASEIQVNATLGEPGFVTVHQAVGEAPADVLGVSAFLFAGEHSDLSVPLITTTEAATRYFVLMFVDDGDGVYESGVDLPVKVDGVVIKEKLEL